MGRQPRTDVPREDEADSDSGNLTPSRYADQILQRSKRKETGTLTLSRGTQERCIRFVRGCPVDAESTLAEEDVAATLVDAGTVPAQRIQWIRKHTGSDEPILEALLEAGTLTRQEVDAHTRAHLHHLVGAGLGWADGTWTWQENPDIGARFDTSLLPTIDPFDALVDGVLRCFDISALRSFVDAPDAGEYVPDPRLTSAKSTNWLPDDLGALTTLLSSSAYGPDIMDQLGGDADRNTAALWLLEGTRWLHRRNPPAALLPLDTVATIQMGRPVTTEVPDKPSRTGKVKTTGKVKSGKSSKKKSAKAAAKSATTPAPEQKPQAAEPLPPSVPKKKKKTQPKIDPHATLAGALAAMANDDFDGAYVKLLEVRNLLPSCPDTLAALGWSSWRSGHHGTNAYDGPEDFILLALTFDPEHPKALEYFARIAIDKGNIDDARNRLLQVLQVSPADPWAKETLDALSPSKSGGMRLWPKGKA